MRGAALVGLLLCALAAPAGAQQGAPSLSYAVPPNTMFQGIDPKEDYVFTDCNASVQVYQFRPFTGDIVTAFRTTLLRDWISGMHKEERPTQPAFQNIAVPGADGAIASTFADAPVGLPKPRLRILVVKGSQAAIVDASTATQQCWQAELPAFQALIQSLKVDAGGAAPGPAIAGGAAVAGLYQGVKAKLTTAMANVTGYDSYRSALHFYLFSADGHVYRHYDALEVPGGDPANFDFARAAREDPMNSGVYAVQGGALVIQMNGPYPGAAPAEPFAVALPRNGAMTIDSVTYERQ